jgi:hypothetical protein
LGLPLFLFPGGRHSSTPFVSLPSSIFWTCPYVNIKLIYNNVNINHNLLMIHLLPDLCKASSPLKLTQVEFYESRNFLKLN